MIKDGKILVNEIFESIDGEGCHAGYPTVFFRTVGCNLRCVWCDSKYTFEPEDSSKWMSVEEAISKVRSFGINHITITGGEPLLEENKNWMTEFIKELLKYDFVVDVETNGSIDYSYWKEKFKGESVYLIMDWKAPSSKMNSSMLESNLLILDEKDDLQNFKGTAWGMYNAISDLISNSVPGRTTEFGNHKKLEKFFDGNILLTQSQKILMVA